MNTENPSGSASPPRVLNLREALTRIPGLWDPHIAGELNGQYVKLARIHGEFDWHAHADEDELFLIVQGAMRLEFRDGVREMSEGEICIVPRGVEHRPVAEEECHILMFEPTSTLNTGDAESEMTVTELKRV